MKSILKSIQINNICGYIIDKIDNIEIISMFSILYSIAALKAGAVGACTCPISIA